MRYEWTASMASGDAEIDAAHRMMIDAINRLDEAVARGTEAAEVPGILSFLESYAWRHFSHEEECFMRHRCPAAEANQQAHAEFVARFTRLRDDLMRDGVTPERVTTLHQALGDWLVNHIATVDTTLRPCMR